MILPPDEDLSSLSEFPAASDGTAAVAAGAGFPEGLSSTLIGEEGYELRFGILDAMGKLENLFFGE